MKKNRGKLVFIGITVLLSLYFLYPTFQDYRLNKQLAGLHGDDSAKFLDEHAQDMFKAKQGRIKLGLDLQGGMRVVLEVNVVRLLEDLAKNKDDVFNGIAAEVRAEAKTSEQNFVDLLQTKFKQKGVRLSKYYGNFRETDDEVLKRLRDETTNAIDRAMEIVRNRVDRYGVSEPSIQKQGSNRIVVELPGVTKEEDVRKLLQGTALLEFKLVTEPEIALRVFESIDKTLAGKSAGDSTKADSSIASAASSDSARAADSALGITEDEKKQAERARKEHPFFALAGPSGDTQNWDGYLYSIEEDKGKVVQILDRPDIKRLVPADMAFSWSAKTLQAANGKKIYRLLAVKRTPELTGGVITDARATMDPTNAAVVDMTMNSDGARDWSRITGANVNKRIAIIMDSAWYSDPKVLGKIPGGRSQITGMANIDEANLLAIVLKAGALPAPVEIIQQASVGASLGEDSVSQGVWAAILALGLTALFMLVYYSTGGAMADVALFLNILFVLGVLAGFQGTLTLPGIAGLILTVAVAVDANVLIYERIREESATGKTLSASIDAGYTRAFTAIFDANLTAFITGVILWQFGSGPVQGFALTLMIGIVASVFSAVVVSRVIIEGLVEKGKHVSFG